MYYVYILKSKKDFRFYIGFTNNLKERFVKHNSGQSTYTRKFMPWVLVYYEAYFSKNDAVLREKQLKRHAKAWGQLKNRIKKSINES